MVGDKMNIVFMGTPQFAVPILEMLSSQENILLVVTQPDKPTGRKKVLMPSPVKEKALSLGIPVFQPIKLKTDYQKIIDLKPDVLITAAYGQMLPKELLDQITAINVHGSLLPKYRGGAPIQYALFDGLKTTGVTIMYMAFRMDAGDMIKQQEIEIDDDDNYQTLSTKLSHVGAHLLKEVLSDLKQELIKPIPQDEKEATFAYTLKPDDEKIHFEMKTQDLINKIRGLSPEPGATANFKNTTIKFYRAQKGDIIDHKAVPGTILSLKKKLIVKTCDGSIELLEIQIPGKKVMATKDFLNGQNIMQVGDVFEGSI
jgi:methionyl-tRNA formyltransferase